MDKGKENITIVKQMIIDCVKKDLSMYLDTIKKAIEEGWNLSVLAAPNEWAFVSKEGRTVNANGLANILLLLESLKMTSDSTRPMHPGELLHCLRAVALYGNRDMLTYEKAITKLVDTCFLSIDKLVREATI